MMTLSNGLTLARAPLALLFLSESAPLRLLAVFLALVTDSIDGYLARKNQSVSRLGAILDPAMDKFFVYFALSTLYFEGKMALWEGGAMVARDFFLCLYGLLMVVTNRWKYVIFRAIRWGKVTTALQFIVLMGLILDASFPWYLYSLFIAMGLFGFLELFEDKQFSKNSR